MRVSTNNQTSSKRFVGQSWEAAGRQADTGRQAGSQCRAKEGQQAETLFQASKEASKVEAREHSLTHLLLALQNRQF